MLVEQQNPPASPVSIFVRVANPVRPSDGLLVNVRDAGACEVPITIPVNRRLFANSRVRGYPLKTLLPQDVALDPATGAACNSISSGGLLFFSLNAELRIALFGAFWLAGFFDVGDLQGMYKTCFNPMK